MKTLKLLAAAALLVVGQAQASVTLLNGQSTTVTYSAVTTDGITLSATIKYTLTFVEGASTATFAITATNNTLNQVGDNRLTSFGIGVLTPSLTSVTDSSSAFDTAVNVNFPGLSQVAFCAYSGGACAGGGGAGSGSLAEAGGTTSFSAFLNFGTKKISDTTGGLLLESPFAIKFQSVGAGSKSVEFTGCASGDTVVCGTKPPTEIPEPTSLALVGLALVGAGAIRRRKTA